jgi:hypothetical protein
MAAATPIAGAQAGKLNYILERSPVSKINRIEGIAKGEKTHFKKDEDYRQFINSVEWLEKGVLPDENTVFAINYEYAQPTGITDLSPGSVVRTIVESIAREMEFMYEQLDLAYLSGFIDSARGDALDMTVALLGVDRKPAQPSSGKVLFGRRTEPQRITITNEGHVYDGANVILLNKENIIEIVKALGTVNGKASYKFKGDDFTLSGNGLQWLPNGIKPDEGTVFFVDYIAIQKIVIHKGSRVATHSRPGEVRVYQTVAESTLNLTPEGKWETEVPIICTTPGRWGNVLAGTISDMPQPVMGIEYVINKEDITNGNDGENDDELRERAKHALDFAAKATVSSLFSALRGVKGVNSVLIEDMNKEMPGVVRAIVDGGDKDQIQMVIDNTRAAGIRVEYSTPKRVHLDFSLTLFLERGALENQVYAQVEASIRSYISSLGISEDVLYARLVEEIHKIKEIWDIRNVEITACRAGEEDIICEGENVAIKINERATPRKVNIVFGKRE